MDSRKYRVTVVALLAIALAAPGCETAGGSAGTGAVAGGVIGGLIGNQQGHALEGAAIGAAVGGLAGWGIHKYRTRQAKTAEETYKDYQYEPDAGFKLDMKGGGVSPSVASPGDKVTATVQYATLGAPPGGVQVHEMRTLKKDGEALLVLHDETVTREDGTWENTLEFQIPNDAEPGTYTVAETVIAEGQRFDREFDVTVQ